MILEVGKEMMMGLVTGLVMGLVKRCRNGLQVHRQPDIVDRVLQLAAVHVAAL
jgi:hypothetical protein